MAPKRALEQSDANVQSTRDPKQQKRDEATAGTENQTPADTATENETEKESELSKELEQKKPEDYICIDKPQWDSKTSNANEDDDEDDEDDDDDDESEEEDEEQSSNAFQKSKMWPKPAAEHPEWKWTMMWRSWQMLCNWSVRASYTIPENFDMYVFEDFHPYGMLELAENAVNEFNKEFTKKDSSLMMMWAPIAMLGFWLCNDNLLEMTMVDDGERVNEFISLMGRMFLTALHTVDRAGKLTKDSEIRDLGLVVTEYLYWSNGLGKYGIGEEDEENFPWREHIIAYAQKAGIDLRTVGCHMNDVLDELEESVEPLDELESAEKSNKADRWDWKKTLKQYSSRNGIRGKIGGQQYDITKMSSAERKAHSFDKVDPLKDIPKEALQKNEIRLGP